MLILFCRNISFVYFYCGNNGWSTHRKYIRCNINFYQYIHIHDVLMYIFIFEYCHSNHDIIIMMAEFMIYSFPTLIDIDFGHVFLLFLFVTDDLVHSNVFASCLAHGKPDPWYLHTFLLDWLFYSFLFLFYSTCQPQGGGQREGLAYWPP